MRLCETSDKEFQLLNNTRLYFGTEEVRSSVNFETAYSTTLLTPEEIEKEVEHQKCKMI